MVGYEAQLRGLGERARTLRVLQRLRQDELAERAGVGVMTVRRFERTGRTSLENALRIAMALRAEGGFDQLFAPPAFRTIDEALAQDEAPRVQRVRNRS